MWFLIDETINNELRENILHSYLKFDKNIQKRHFNSKGKEFFITYKGARYIKDLLESLKKTLYDYYDDPVIDHIFVLSKSPGGNETPPHQDFTFWTNKTNSLRPKKMITFWLPLIDVNEYNGGLKLVESEQAENINQLNNGNEKHYEHFHAKGSLGFSWNISKSPKLKSLDLNAGNWLAFDSYSIHSSNPNNSRKSRVALKIVFGEKKEFKPLLFGRLRVKQICKLSHKKAALFIYSYFLFRRVYKICDSFNFLNFLIKIRNFIRNKLQFLVALNGNQN